MPRRSNHRIRRRLWERDPHCYYCGVETVWKDRLDTRVENAATIEHLRSRYNPRRMEPNRGNDRRLVLACWKCNNGQNRVEQAQVPLAELHRRSGRGGQTSGE